MMSKIRDHYDTLGHDYVTRNIDSIQQEFECCGLNSYADWQSSTWYQNQINSRFRGEPAPQIPWSCCVTLNETSASSSSSSSSSPSLSSPSTSPDARIVNETACMFGTGPGGGTLPNEYMFSEGCHQFLKEPVDLRVLTLAGVGLGLFLVQFLCIGVLINLFRKMGPNSPAQMGFRETDTAREALDKLDYWLDRETEELKKQSAQRKRNKERKSVKFVAERT